MDYRFVSAFVFFIALATSGCGGGGSGPDPDPPGAGDIDPVGVNQGSSLESSNLIVASIEGNGADGLVAAMRYNGQDDLLALTGQRAPTGNISAVEEAFLRVPNADGGFIVGVATFNSDGLLATITVSGERAVFDDYTDSDVRITLFDAEGNQRAAAERVPLDSADLAKIKSGYDTLFPSNNSLQSFATSQSAVQAHQVAAWASAGLNLGGCALSSALAIKTFGLLAPFAVSSCGSAALSVGAAFNDGQSPELQAVSTAVNGALCTVPTPDGVLGCSAAASDVAALALRGEPNATIVMPDEAAMTVFAGDELTFYGIGAIEYADIEAFEWNFADGSISNNDSTSHAFTFPGVYQVRFTVSYVDGTVVEDSVRVDVDIGLSAPTLQSITSEDGALEISWSNVSGAAGYNLYFSTVSDTASSGTITEDVSSPYILSGLQNGTQYFVVVRAFDSAGVESQASLELSGTPAADANDGLSRGLAAHFPFNGSAQDVSGNGHDGIVEGANPTFDRNGNPESAYAFDGLNDRITFPSPTEFDDIFNEGSYTFNVWFNKEGDSFGYENLFSHTLVAHDQRMSTSNNNELGWRTEYKGQRYWSTPDAFNDNEWTMATFVYDAGARLIRMYVNGVLLSENVADNWEPVAHAYEIGDNSPSEFNRSWNGKIDDIRIYERALSESEINQLLLF